MSEPVRTIDGKYDILRQLGEGGMGAVYEARHRGTARRVAIKVIGVDALRKGPDSIRRFQREAMATGPIESHHIAHVLDTGMDEATGSPYLVMELLVGDDLHQAIARLGPLAPDLVLRIGAQACLGLQKAHEAGVVHRDIKPANIFLARRDAGEITVKLLDFGIAKLAAGDLASPQNHELTRTGAMIGSPLYMSPEQAVGRKTIDHRTDVWSLGVVLYEALTGTVPHGYAEVLGELVIRICQEPPRPVQEHSPWVPPEVAAIVHRALALNPDARFESTAAMYGAIRALLPQGHAIDGAMLVPLSAEARVAVASRYALTSDARIPAPSLVDPRPPLGRGTTMAEMGRSTEPEPPRPSTPRRILPFVAVCLALAGVAIGAAVLRSRGHDAASASATLAPSAITSVPIAAPPAPAPPPSVSAILSPPVTAEPARSTASSPPATKRARPPRPAPATTPTTPKPAAIPDDRQ